MSTKSSTHSSHKYRPDIDGLRAIAVLAVVFYHAGLKQLSGGYVGVDVFFVISGYLITQFIDQRVLAGRFSLVEFYERRVRRILPALFFLLFAANLASYFALLPQDLVKFAKSEIATVLFIPNLFFFYWGSGYFETGTKLKPLLHMWSLGVEEQFYIFFPLIMFFVSRWGRRAKIASVWLLFTFSFVLSCWEVQYRGLRDSAFYLVPFRAWELLLGSLIALGAFRLIRSEYVRNALAAAGLFAILISAFTYSSSTPFPGLSALAPCLGAALIIYANESGPTLAGKFLSLRPMLFVGLISYSLYLWHWPVIVYAKQFIGRPLSIPERTLTVLLSFAFAILSWRFVERPFRNSSPGVRHNFLFAQAALAAVVIIAIGQSFLHLRGVPQRFPQQALAYANAGNDWGTDRDVCRTATQVEQLAPCHFGSAKKATPDFILWGDSHAESLAPAFDSLAKDSAMLGWVASYPACLPLLEVRRVDTPGCPEFNAAIVSLIESKDIKTVVLAGRWAVPSLGLSDGELEDGRPQVLLVDSSSQSRSLLENEKVLDRGLRRVLSRLTAEHRKVILVLDVPDTGVNTPGYLVRSVIEGKISSAQEDARIVMTPYSQASSRVDDLLVHTAAEFHADSIDPKKDLCQASQCLIARDGHSLYHDSNHLTAFGALQLVRSLRPFLTWITGTPGATSAAGLPLPAAYARR
jgi:peptidoglycan/LPS O-acetylase OafA/YrhL